MDQLLANRPEQLNAQVRTTRPLAAAAGGQEQQAGEQVLVQFAGERALLWAAEWAERGRRAKGGGGGGGDAAGGRTTAAEVVAGGRGGLPGKWLLQLLQGALQSCALASSGVGTGQ